jgi:hypothetical protein
MAMFTDGLVSELPDLLGYEADLLDVAGALKVELGVKLQLAQTEVGAQLEATSRRPGNVFLAKGAGWQSTGGETSAPRFDLSQVVVTPPLKLWHTFQTLALFYRDAQARKVDDKYLPKWREYKELAKWASDLLFQTGVGLAMSPVPRGEQPVIGFESSTLPAMSLYARTTWVGHDGTEGAGSKERAVHTVANQALKLTMGPAPAAAAGWHVYIGQSQGEALRQTNVPLIEGAEWVMPLGGIVDGPELGNGQPAEMYRTAPKFLQRG